MIVLDTHALVWAAEGDQRLGGQARYRLQEEAARAGVLVPAICAWEIALLAKRGQVALSYDPKVWMRRVLNEPGYRLAAFEPDIAIDSVRLDWAHKDPADRLIVATALHWRAPLMTKDRAVIAFAGDAGLEIVNASQ